MSSSEITRAVHGVTYQARIASEVISAKSAFSRDQVFLEYEALVFWALAAFVTVVFVEFGMSVRWLILGGMMFVVIRNLATDQSGIRNLVFLTAAMLIGAFPFRYEVGNGVAESTSAFNVWLYVLVIVVLAVELSRVRRAWFGASVWLVLAYLTIVFLAALAGGDVLETKRRILFAVSVNYLFFVLAYVVARRNSFRGVIVPVLLLFLLATLVDYAYGIYQYIAAIPNFELDAFEKMELEKYILPEDYVKIIGLSGSAYGVFYNIPFFTVGLYGLLSYFEKRLVWLPVSVIIGSLVLLTSLSERTAVVMLGISLVVFALMRYSRLRARRVVIVLLVFAIAGVLVLPLVSSLIVTPFDREGGKFERMKELASPGDAVTMIWRFAKWEEGYGKIGSSLITGDKFEGEYTYHMEYLNVFVTFGLGGFVVWISFLASIFRGLWRLARVSRDALRRALSFGLIPFFVAMLFSAIPNNPFTYSCGLVLFVLAAICVAGPVGQIPGSEAVGHSLKATR